jgi:hypothetical protein
MFTPRQYRAKADEYTELAKTAETPEAAQEFTELKQSFATLADNEQWLSDNYQQTIHAKADERPNEAAANLNKLSLAVEEDKILRYLGAALIMQWNTLPRKLQRELFDLAGSMGELLNTAELRGQIARFLHRHKDDSR